MKRLEGWEGRLDAFVAGHQDRPFSWGQHDCCQFARTWLIELTGEDPTPDLAPYQDAGGAAQVLADNGWRNVYNAIRRRLGSPVPPAFLKRGDIVFAHLKGGDFEANSGAGICLGSTSIFPGADGLVSIPTGKCKVGWRIG